MGKKKQKKKKNKGLMTPSPVEQARTVNELFLVTPPLPPISETKLQTENMEVYHHPHTPDKKWTHYFWEFFMLFMAVTLGFFVENQREHYTENKREKQYIHSIAEDFRMDIYQLDSIIRTRKAMDTLMDSLLYIMNYTDPKKHGNEIYSYTRRIPRTYRFYATDRTMAQLKNAGNWRLIRNQKVSEALSTYDNLVRTFTVYIEQREESLVLILYQSINKLFDNRVFESMVTGLGFTPPKNNPQLLSYDRNAINEFCNQVHFRKNSNLYFTKTAERLLDEAQKTLSLIEKEYHLK